MEFKKISFLFFMMVAMNCLIAQKEIDSSSYYYRAILTPQTSEHLPLGIQYYKKRLELHKKQNDTTHTISDLRLLAIGEFKIGNIYDSETYIVEALQLVRANSFADTLVNAKIGLYNQLGRIYRSQLNIDEAMKAFNEALGVAPTIRDSIVPLNNKANIFKDLEKYDDAAKIYAFLAEKSRILNDSLQWALALDNLGAVQSQLKDDGALDNLIKAKEIRQNKNYLTGLYSSFKNLSYYFKDAGNDITSKSYADSAYFVAQNINSTTYTLDALSLYLQQSTDPKIAAYKKLKDSMEIAKTITENKNAYAKYNLAEEQKKTEASNLLREIERRKRIQYQALVSIATVLLFASFFVYRYRYKKMKVEEVYKTESRISKKVHDEVANDMYKVIASLELDGENKEATLDKLEKIYLKTRNISKETGDIDVDSNFGMDLNDMLLGYKNQKVSLVTVNLNKIHWEKYSSLKKVGIYRVLQELMTNMRKHSKATSVAISFEGKKKKLQIKYSDNGIGCTLKKTSGLQNAENRIHSLDGKISFETSPGNGFKATILV
ncbi:tetratricopeptide repeat-containing sensor histidine kinase [Maribacter aurantiacus]|uniref:ATP-binding protein n=1 Tax=Maribacter aurantiacus TaxID=1882343 RepID=A0A5R8M5J8_9FLAO|nr:tetratricopeptide repeat-containing sensor histidine kinase [Maribacter aurantiacus]TLF44837.1 ATP-binding protein [Maribacter aurantiacus]